MPFDFDASKVTSAVSGFVTESITGFAESFIDDTFGLRNRLYYKDSQQSAYDFGQKSPYFLNNTPRLKFQYFAKINFNSEATDINGEPYVSKFLNPSEQAMLVPLMKEVTLPSMRVNTEKINQYNHWRLAQTKIEYEPVTIKMHDVVDGKTLRFWEMYFEYYFKDSIDTRLTSVSEAYTRKIDNTGEYSGVGYSDDIIENDFNTDFGYNLETVKDQKNLISSIDIYQVHASRWSKIMLINPRISTFTHDTIAYQESSLTEMTFTFDSEQVMYHNFFTPFTPDDLTGMTEILSKADALELANANPSTSTFQPRQRTLTSENQSVMLSSNNLPNTSVFGNLQGSINDLLDAGPGQLGDAISQSMVTGEFKSPFDAKAISKQLMGNLSNAATTVPAKNFGSAVKDASSSFIDVFR